MARRKLLQAGTACSLVMSLAGGINTAAVAQQQAQVGLEEITVTARRREESLMQVPVAVSAVTADTIFSKGIKDIKELAEFTPGMFAQVGGNGRVDRTTRRLTFRGLSVDSGSTFIDGAPGGSSFDVTDVERVEVLKGPQSVYFGRSTFSGAVNYVIKKPSDTFKGRVNVDVYSYGGFETSLTGEGPLVQDRLGIRVRGKRMTFGGQYKNGGANHQDEMMGRQSTSSVSSSIVATPTDALTITAFGAFSHDDDGVPPELTIKVPGQGDFGGPQLKCELGGTGGAWWCGPLPRVTDFDPRYISVYAIVNDFTRRELIENVRGYPVPFDPKWLQHFGNKRDFLNGYLKFDYEFGDSGWEAHSIISYTHSKTEAIVDQHYRDTSTFPNPFYPATPALLAAACAAPSTSTANAVCFTQPFIQHSLMNQGLGETWSVEARVLSPQDARLRGTLGASFYRSDSAGGSNFGFGASGRITQASTKGKVRTPAVFGGLYFDVMQGLTVSAEGRYQRDTVASRQLFPAFGPEVRGTFPTFTPRVTVDYALMENTMVYATWSRGVRPGGFNTGLFGLTPFILSQITSLGSNERYEAELLDNYELGYKASWLDHRIQLAAAVYYEKWHNGQVGNTLFIFRDNGTIGSVSVTQNVGLVNLKGIELEADFAISEGLKLSATLDLNHNTVASYVYLPDGPKINNTTNVNGKRLQQAPAQAWTLSPTYTHTLVGDWYWTARIDYRHRGKMYVDQANLAWTEPHDYFNVRAGLNRPNLKIEFYVNNLFDDKKLVEGIKMNDPFYGPGTTCPPCYTAALPVNTRGGTVLNDLRVGMPSKRTFGIAANYEF